jgi:hypothetical protein
VVGKTTAGAENLPRQWSLRIACGVDELGCTHPPPRACVTGRVNAIAGSIYHDHLALHARPAVHVGTHVLRIVTSDVQMQRCSRRFQLYFLTPRSAIPATPTRVARLRPSNPTAHGGRTRRRIIRRGAAPRCL